MKKLGIYVHIPFCIKKCLYCDFNSFSDKDEYKEEYINALADEINSADFLSKYEIKSIFFGGGTPTCLPIKDLSFILSKINRNKIAKNAEISIEANPGTVNYKYLCELKKIGFNRISFGLQSAENRLLKNLGRIHTYEEFLGNYNSAKKAGFDNINVDLMYALPGQSLFEWKKTLEEIVSLEPSHISIYSLIIEKETVFGKLLSEGKLKHTDEEIDREMYYYAKSFLEANGFYMYEISNFAKNNHESVHNKIYWECNEYIGFGLSAHSFLDGRRFANTEDLFDYLNNKRLISEEKITYEESIEEFIFLGLRMAKGISIIEFEKRFGRNIFDIFGNNLKYLINTDYILEKDGRLILSEKGIFVSDSIFSKILNC